MGALVEVGQRLDLKKARELHTWQRKGVRCSMGGQRGSRGCRVARDTALTQNAHKIVRKKPPMKPSHVFFGDSLINGCTKTLHNKISAVSHRGVTRLRGALTVFPKKKPDTYAMESLQTTMPHGMTNLSQHTQRTAAHVKTPAVRWVHSARQVGRAGETAPTT